MAHMRAPRVFSAENAIALGHDIAQARREFRISQSNLAEELGIEPSTLADIEAGASNRRGVIKKVCAWLGVELRAARK